MNKNKGITLIALVITIIVMLILVTVTIRVATDGNLFTHAANAASRTKIAAAEENELSSGNIGGKSIEEIVAEQTTEPVLIHFIIGDTEYTAEEGMTWGDWIVKSKYNKDGFKVGEENLSGNPDDPAYPIVTSDGLKQVGGVSMNPRTHQQMLSFCTSKAIISDGASYVLMDM